jgi:hypothetical protein
LKKLFVDTGAWYALNNKNDANHEHVLRCFQVNKGNVLFITSDYVIDEAITLTRVRINHLAASKLARELLSEKAAKIIYAAPEYIPRALEIFTKYSDQDFSFTDCTSFAIMEKLKIFEALAFDSHFTFEKYGFTQVST